MERAAPAELSGSLTVINWLTCFPMIPHWLEESTHLWTSGESDHHRVSKMRRQGIILSQFNVCFIFGACLVVSCFPSLRFWQTKCLPEYIGCCCHLNVQTNYVWKVKRSTWDYVISNITMTQFFTNFSLVIFKACFECSLWNTLSLNSVNNTVPYICVYLKICWIFFFFLIFYAKHNIEYEFKSRALCLRGR